MKNFEGLDPDTMINAVEEFTGKAFTGLAAPMPSYINRVYEFESTDRERYIAKFYRPGRWTKKAIEEEHIFVCQCAEDEIPVIPPLKNKYGKTLSEHADIYFTVYPKRFGRELEIKTDEDWLRIGSAIARMHIVGSTAKAPSRTVHHPLKSTKDEVEFIIKSDFQTRTYIKTFENVCDKIIKDVTPLFENSEYIRVHGDCHRANILERPGEGIMIIDFDDMMTAPPIQDLWLLLPGYARDCAREIDLLVEGYEQFRDFESDSIELIEPLRAMRIIYFLSWCAKQKDDYKFKTNFPDWGSDSFWEKEINDLKRQCASIKNFQRARRKNTVSMYPGRILTDH